MTEHLTEAYAICGRLVQKHDADRHAAILFAPQDRRAPLHALQAFALEIAGVRGQVKEPLPGEIRLQWWRDVLNGERLDEASGHPVALAIRDAIVTNRLPLQALQDLIDARAGDLYDDPPQDWNALEGYAGETSSMLFSLASIILLHGEAPGHPDAAGHAGVAYAITGLLRAFPWHARRGQVFLPKALMQAVDVTHAEIIAGKDSDALRAALAEMRRKAREHLNTFLVLKATLQPEIAPAFLPLLMVEPYLARMERHHYSPFVDVIDVLHWQRLWAMWRGR